MHLTAYRSMTAFLFAVVLLAFLLPPTAAQSDGQPALNIYNENPWRQLPLKEVHSQTVIDGPLAKTKISYLVENKNTERSEVGLNFHVPKDTVLTAFGYYYRGRFIRGKMYDTNEAWKIYTAVTSRGRDPGIMNRDDAQDYHVQVYPVEAGHDLRFVVELSQALTMDAAGAHFELPLTQIDEIHREVKVRSDVRIQGHAPGEIQGNEDAHTTKTQSIQGAQILLRGSWLPKQNWELTIPRASRGLIQSVYSAQNPSKRNGYFALAVTAPYALVNPRVTLNSRPGTNDTLPTRFSTISAYGRLLLMGRYYRPGALNVTIHSRGRAALHLIVSLSDQVVAEHDNPAAGLWADKRIAALQGDHTRDHREQVVGLSKRFTVVSQYTALLAIPAEELAYYRKVLANQKIGTNTRAVGGGGGDPYIAVKAPADAQQVVAVFPNGDVKNLIFNTAKNLWDGRFDIPFGTPAGDYQVAVIVVHRDGTRTRFTLLYQYLTHGPIAGDLKTLRARPGGPFQLQVTGQGIARAVAILPWGERVDLEDSGLSSWTATLRVPATWPKGNTMITVVLLDGAHDRTEVSLDLDVR